MHSLEQFCFYLIFPLTNKHFNMSNTAAAKFCVFLQSLRNLHNYQQCIDGLVQERRNSSALAMELHLYCTNPSV